MSVWTPTREDITLLIAIAGFLMSLYNCVKTIWDSRCGLSVIYKSHYCASYPNGKTMLLIHLLFENLSAKPYSVTRIFLQADGSEYEFAFPSQEIWEFTRREGENVIKRSEVMSQTLPFRVEGYGAAGGYFVVFIPKELAASFSCSTNIRFGSIQT